MKKIIRVAYYGSKVHINGHSEITEDKVEEYKAWAEVADDGGEHYVHVLTREIVLGYVADYRVSKEDKLLLLAFYNL